MKEFDPDKPYVKVRGMGQVHYEQNGSKFSAGYKYVGKLKGAPAEAKPAKKQGDVRARAAAKIAKKQKDASLDGFRNKETPGAVSSGLKENEAARQAEENA